MRRYLVFGGDEYHPEGGIDDLVASFDSIELAISKANELESGMCLDIRSRIDLAWLSSNEAIFFLEDMLSLIGGSFFKNIRIDITCLKNIHDVHILTFEQQIKSIFSKNGYIEQKMCLEMAPF